MNFADDLPEDEKRELTEGEKNFLSIQGLDPDNLTSGLRCQNCGCTDLRVRNTINSNNEIKRYRICRNCGLSRRTREIYG